MYVYTHTHTHTRARARSKIMCILRYYWNYFLF